MDLQTQIAEQATEIETLNGEIRLLRTEVSDLSHQITAEREKSVRLQEEASEKHLLAQHER